MLTEQATTERAKRERAREASHERELKRRVGPILSDGTKFTDLVDIDNREVSMRVLSDADIYRLEMERIFYKSWICVGHDSEIPNPGDFMLRYVGEDPVIVSRTADGQVHCVLNVCSHRGMEICWADDGNQSSFKCPYHGWVFDGSGKLLGAPFEKEMYPGWDKSKYGLRTGRVALRQGIIFVNFDSAAPSFEDYAGDMLWYLDRQLGGIEWEPVGQPHRVTILSNWKILMDQLAGDAYHAATLHHSLMEMGFQPPEPTFLDHVKVTVPPTGHSVFTLNSQNPSPDNPYAIDGRGLVSVVFPNSGLGAGPRTGPGPISANVLLHVPKGPEAFEQWQINIVPKGTPAEIKHQIARMGSISNGAILIDDSQQGPSMQRASSFHLGGQQPMRYFSRGETHHPETWPGPGVAHAGYSKDETSWEFWKHWYQVMTTEA